MGLKPILIACSFLFSPILMLHSIAQSEGANLKMGKIRFVKRDRISPNLQKKIQKYSRRLTAINIEADEKLITGLPGRDSIELRELQFNHYEVLPNHRSQNYYSPKLDSLATAIRFLGEIKHNDFNRYSIWLDQVAAIEDALTQTDKMLGALTKKQNMLLKVFGFSNKSKVKRLAKQISKYQSKGYYLKSLVENRNKLESVLINTALKHRAFQTFFATNSRLSSIFRLPAVSDESNDTGIIFPGIQTRAIFGRELNYRFGKSATAQQLAMKAEGLGADMISELKKVAQERIAQYSSFNKSEVDLSQCKQSESSRSRLSNRFEFGGDVQIQRGSLFFPVSSNVAFSVAYRFNTAVSAGISGVYRVGLGAGWKNISLTHEGVGFRSFIDVKAKGDLFISGSYEQNHYASFKRIADFQNRTSWQTSGLIGLKKRYQRGNKSTAHIQVLWDFLNLYGTMYSSPFIIRVGYSLK